MEQVEKDRINHPDHYTAGSIEVYDFIEAWHLDFAIGNVVKYVTRAPYKGTQLDDLKKARWYLNKAIEKEERAIASRVTDSLVGMNNAPDANVSSLAWPQQTKSAMEYYHQMREAERMKNEAYRMSHPYSLPPDRSII